MLNRIKDDRGFTLIEVILAACIFLIIVIAILGLAQLEANAITSAWKSSYYDTALIEAKQVVDGLLCDRIPLIDNKLIIEIGREKIAVIVDKVFEEKETGKIMWTLIISIKGGGRYNSMEIKRYCP